MCECVRGINVLFWSQIESLSGVVHFGAICQMAKLLSDKLED